MTEPESWSAADPRTPYQCRHCRGYVLSADALERHERLCPDEQVRLQAAVHERDKIIAAIVTQHGEALGNGRHRLQLAPEHLETAEARRLTIIVDPNSGAMLLRAQPL